MKRLTNKVLVAFLLLSVANSVFGNPESTGTSFADLPKIVRTTPISWGEEVAIEAEMAAMRYGSGGLWICNAETVQKSIETGEMAKHGLIHSVEPVSVNGFFDNTGPSKVITMLTKVGLYEPVVASAFESIAAAAKSQFNIDTGLKGIAAAAESQFNAGIHKGFSSIAALAEKLSTSTLSERLAMKVGLVNKAKEIVHTVANTTVGRFIGNHPDFAFAVGALAVYVGLNAAYNKLYVKSVQDRK